MSVAACQIAIERILYRIVVCQTCLPNKMLCPQLKIAYSVTEYLQSNKSV